MMVPSPLAPSRVLTVLRQSPLPALRKLAVEETEDMVVLHGCVPSYYFKQLAQEAVMPLLKGRQLHNRVTVVRPEWVLVSN